MTTGTDLELTVMPKADARELTERIRAEASTCRKAGERYAESKKRLLGLVREAKAGNAHIVLGFESWTAYLADTLENALHQLAQDDRQDAVLTLTAEGMTTRAIAPILGVSQMTVVNDLKAAPEKNFSPATGMDGKTYTRKSPPRHPEPTPEQQAEAVARREAEGRRQARIDLHTAIGRALITLGDCGSFEDALKLMRDYDPAELDPPQVASGFDPGNLTNARRFISELIEWENT